MCVSVCVSVRSRSRVFSCLVLVSHGKKWNIFPQTGPPSSGQNKLPKADPSCLPSLPLSGDFHHSAEAAIRAKAPLIFIRSSSCICHLFLADVIHFDASRLSQGIPPLRCHSPLSSLCVFIVWRNQENCLRSCCALTTPEPCCAFFGPCYSFHPTSPEVIHT